MNKAVLNRKIQLLENQVKELKKVNRSLLNCECEECSKKRKAKHEDFMKTFREWQNLLNDLENKYGKFNY